MPDEHHVSRKDYQRDRRYAIMIIFNKYNHKPACNDVLRFTLWVINTLCVPDAINRQGNFACFMCRIRQANLNVKEINDQHKPEIYSDGGLQKC